MKRLKINSALAALVLGVTVAFAFKAPAPPKDTLEWYRTSTFANRESSNSWVQGVPPSCLSATKICSAYFEADYDPNDHSLVDNQSAAEGTITNGYSPE